ncbi:MAG: type secretion integral inner rane ring protein [Chlamydiota bacterium]|jgi:type III secretion system YscD/HrpQ family protein
MPAHLFAFDGPYKGLTLTFDEGNEWVIGRDPASSDLVLDDTTVSRKHARVTKSDKGFSLRNLSRVNPTLINDEEVEGTILLKEGDRIQIGDTFFTFSEKEIPKETHEVLKKKGGYDDIFGDLEDPPSEAPLMEEPTVPTHKEVKAEKEPGEPTAYDTIFEESPHEESIPFHLASEMPLLLKVISGPNAGAEIGIEKDHSYVIGKDPNSCDIVFQDLSVSRTHARLNVSNEGELEIEDLGSKNGTLANGVAFTGKKTITSQDVISMGTTVFLIIDREAPQETLYSPMIPSSVEALKPQSMEEAPSEETPIAVKEPTDWKKEPIPPKYLVMALSFAAVFLIVFVSFFSLFKTQKTEVAHKQPTHEIQEALAKYTNVQFSFNPGSGKLFLVGHVLTNVDYQELRYRVGEIPFIRSIEDTIVIDEGVAKMMNDVLTENGAWKGVSIRPVEAGKFVMNGYVATNDQASRLAEYVTVNFPYLDRLHNAVIVEENLSTQLQSMLQAEGFGTVAMQLTNGTVVLSGKYSDKMESEYRDLVKEINAIPGVTQVKDLAIAATPNQAAIDVSDQYTVSGTSLFDGLGYSCILNGKIYTIGDAVDGMKITTIGTGTIVLEKDGIKYRIEYTR